MVRARPMARERGIGTIPDRPDDHPTSGRKCEGRRRGEPTGESEPNRDLHVSSSPRRTQPHRTARTNPPAAQAPGKKPTLRRDCHNAWFPSSELGGRLDYPNSKPVAPPTRTPFRPNLGFEDAMSGFRVVEQGMANKTRQAEGDRGRGSPELPDAAPDLIVRADAGDRGADQTNRIIDRFLLMSNPFSPARQDSRVEKNV